MEMAILVAGIGAVALWSFSAKADGKNKNRFSWNLSRALGRMIFQLHGTQSE